MTPLERSISAATIWSITLESSVMMLKASFMMLILQVSLMMIVN